MESKLAKLKTDFNNIINIRTTVKNIFDILQIRIDKLKLLYAEFIKTSKTQMFIFGLDSFHFQSKLIDIEYDDMKRLFLAINNRMYCEYFKLYKIIIDYIMVNISDRKITEIVKVNSYPVYKDLEPFKEYKFEIILDMHENILNLLGILISTLNNKENELLLHKNKQNIGLNIDNFITTFNYSIIVMREKIIMFITYIEFFHKLHTKYLKRFANKIQLMYMHINNDIQFDESVQINKKSKINKNRINHNDSSESSNSENDLITDSDQDSNLSNNIPNLQFSIDFLDDISDKSGNDSLTSNNSMSTPKYTLITPPKNLIKNDMFDLSITKKEEETKDIESSLSHEDLSDMFSTINMSCNSIINNENPSEINITSDENHNTVETTVESNIATNNLIEPTCEIENNNILLEKTIEPNDELITLTSPIEYNKNEEDIEGSVSTIASNNDTLDDNNKKRKQRKKKTK